MTTRRVSSQLLKFNSTFQCDAYMPPLRSTIQLALILIFILSSFLISLAPDTANAGQVTLAWDMNSEPNVAGYKIYYGTASRNYDWSIDVGNVSQITITDLPDGLKYYFTATAYDNSSPPVESTYSDEVNENICTYSISPVNVSFNASGGTGSVSVTTQAGCAWKASSGAPWMTITSGSSGTGNGTINYSVSANTNADTRATSSTFAGKVFTVTQSGAANHTITASAGAGGSITPSGNVAVPYGSSQTFTIIPNSGYAILDVLVDGSSVGAVSSYTFKNVTSSHSISTNFVLGYTLTVTTSGTGSGYIVANPSVAVYTPGTKITLKSIRDGSSNFDGFSGDCTSNKPSCNFIINNNAVINAAFELKNFKVLTTAIGNGTVSVEESASIKNKNVKNVRKMAKVSRSNLYTTIDYGSQLVYHINPEPGYYIKKVFVDGKRIETVDTLTFADIKRNHRVKVRFESETKLVSQTALKTVGKQVLLHDNGEQNPLQTETNDPEENDSDNNHNTKPSSANYYASVKK